MQLAKQVYRASDQFPDNERFALTSQLRRAATSIPCNIAEGSARNSDKAFAYFVDIALGSAAEVETLLILSHDLGFMNEEELATIIDDLRGVSMKIRNLRTRLTTRGVRENEVTYATGKTHWIDELPTTSDHKRL